jgi:Spy/CpxP family protein refolding chaperone
MRTFIAGMVVVAASLVCPGFIAADEPKAGEGLAERIQDLNLTDEQETKIADIMKESQPKVQEAAKELAEVVKQEEDKVRAVLTPEQTTKIQALKEERKEHRFEGLCERIAHLRHLDLTDAEKSQIDDIQKEYRPKMVKALEGLKGILTDEQRKAREDGLNAGKKRREILASLNLTADQKEKEAAVAKEVAEIAKQEMEKIRDVLTQEQQAKLPELKDERRDRVRDRWACRIANLMELNLAPEQKTQIADIRKEFRPKVHEAGNKLRGAARDEVEAVLVVIKG